MARPGLGLDLIDRADGDEPVKRRVRLCLATIAGDLSVEDARRQLGLSKQAFHDLRARVIAGAIAGGTPRQGGRPPATASVDEELATARADLAAAQARAAHEQQLARVMLEGLRVREELHAVLGSRLRPPDAARLARRFGLDSATAATVAKGGRPAAATTPDVPPPPPPPLTGPTAP